MVGLEDQASQRQELQGSPGELSKGLNPIWRSGGPDGEGEVTAALGRGSWALSVQGQVFMTHSRHTCIPLCVGLSMAQPTLTNAH